MKFSCRLSELCFPWSRMIMILLRHRKSCSWCDSDFVNCSETSLHSKTLNDDGSWPLSPLTYSEIGHRLPNPSIQRSQKWTVKSLKSEWTEKWVLCHLNESLCVYLAVRLFQVKWISKLLFYFSQINELLQYNGMPVKNDIPTLPNDWWDKKKNRPWRRLWRYDMLSPSAIILSAATLKWRD